MIPPRVEAYAWHATKEAFHAREDLRKDPNLSIVLGLTLGWLTGSAMKRHEDYTRILVAIDLAHEILADDTIEDFFQRGDGKPYRSWWRDARDETYWLTRSIRYDLLGSTPTSDE